MTAELGTARAVDARAHGQPGKRTFQMRVLGSGYQSASLWLEKQHLQALNMAFTQMLAQLGEPSRGAVDIASFPDQVDHDFRVGRMSIGYDTSENTIVLHVFSEGRDEDDEDPDLRVRVTKSDCASLNSRLEGIISGGRPLCPLCGSPVDAGGHACARTNGHLKQAIPRERMDDED
jgi:uncharacterized repeat protein (TIGR03847 family)